MASNAERSNVHVPARSVDELIRMLGSKDDDGRKNARTELEDAGHLAVAPLIKALEDPDERVRWSAAKALGNIGDPAAATGLAKAMADDSFDVRWMAAEGLVRFGRRALEPLLRVLATRPDSSDLYRVAHCVVRNLADDGFADILGPVEAALDGVEPAIEAPNVARMALEKIRAA